ncbi:MAG: hypothetical protein U0271_21055 [Polyangiaceae bacterium]
MYLRRLSTLAVVAIGVFVGCSQPAVALHRTAPEVESPRPVVAAPPRPSVVPVASSVVVSDALAEGELVSLGPHPHVLCGGLMATQTLEIRITRAPKGSGLTEGQVIAIKVLACGAGTLMMMSPNGVTFELDPTVLHPGTALAFDPKGLAEVVFMPDELTIIHL